MHKTDPCCRWVNSMPKTTAFCPPEAGKALWLKVGDNMSGRGPLHSTIIEQSTCAILAFSPAWLVDDHYQAAASEEHVAFPYRTQPSAYLPPAGLRG